MGPSPIESAFSPLDFVPPVVAMLPQMAEHDAQSEAAAALRLVTLDRAFEIHINLALTILGFRTTLLGQGAGRGPDGIAISQEGQYAIIWDAKVRRDVYRMGTDDRAIREYINTRCRKLRKLGCLNIYFAVISSRFASDCDPQIRNLRIATGVSAVCLIEATALVAMVGARVRRPLDVELNETGYQRLFAEGGIITIARVQSLIVSLELDD